MLKIGEFSQLGQVTVRTLHHYDNLGLLKPAYIDPDSDYRYYSIEQLPRLNRIVALKDLGLTLEQIAHLLDSAVSAAEMRGMLELRQAELAQRISDEQMTLARVAARLRQIEQEGNISRYEVARKSVPALMVATIRQLVPDLKDITPYRCHGFDELYAWLERHHITPAGQELVLYNVAEYVEHDIDMEIGVVVPTSAAGMGNDRVTIYELPAVAELASVVHHGDMWGITDTFIALCTWLQINHAAIAGPYREIHLFGRENDYHSLDNIVIEMQLPINMIVE